MPPRASRRQRAFCYALVLCYGVSLLAFQTNAVGFKKGGSSIPEKHGCGSNAAANRCSAGRFRAPSDLSQHSLETHAIAPEGTLGGQKRSSAPPNIVMVVLDDVGWAGIKGYNEDIVGNNPHSYPHTPNFDAAIAGGIKLKNLYVQPMCSPTRAAVMTGRYPHRYGAQTFVQRPYQPTFLPDDETTVADKLVGGGYSTALVGKWHLGYGLRKYTPTSRGFQRFFGSYEVGGDHYNHTVGPDTHAMGQLFTMPEGYQQTLDLHREYSKAGRMQESHEFVTTERGVYSSELFSRESVDEINRHAAFNAKLAGHAPRKSLFLYVAYTTIHTPLQVDQRYINMNLHLKADEGEEGCSMERLINAGMMSAMDEGFGKIVKALRAHDMWDNTVVILFSDNGGMISQGASNFPLRGLKMGPFEGGIRSVAVVSGGHPDVVHAAGSTSNAMLHAVDIHTIILHLAGVSETSAREGLPPKKLDAHAGGRLWQSITSADRIASPRTEFVALLDPIGNFPSLNRAAGWTLLGKCSSIRVGKYKLIVGMPGRDDWFPVEVKKCFKELKHEGTTFEIPLENKDCVRGDFRYENVNKGLPYKDIWLFDIEKDPWERNDLSASHPDVVNRLKSKIEVELARSVNPLPDRWANIAAMMAGIYHTPTPGGGYEAGLASWQEPEHLAQVNFLRRAWSWVRIKGFEAGMIVLGRGQVHKTAASSEGVRFADDDERIEAAMRVAFGLEKGQEFTKEQGDYIVAQLIKIEASAGQMYTGKL